MPSPQVFISHSKTRDTSGHTGTLLTKLEKELSSVGYDIRDDEQIRKGQEWRDELHTWMGLCDAAVILFSRQAVQESPWVLKEATIFYWRRSLNRDFVLIPVLLPGVTRDDLSQGAFSALGLNDLQAVDGADLDRAVQEIQARLEPVKLSAVTNAPLSKPRSFIAFVLEGIPYSILREAGRKIAASVAGWQEDDANQRLAQELLHLDYSRFVKLVDEVLGVYLVKQTPSVRHAFLDVLTQFSVDPLAVAKIPGLSETEAGSPRAVIAVNARLTFTGTNYVRRASCSYPPGWTALQVVNETGPDSLGRLRKEIRAAIRSHYATMPDDTDEDVRRFVKDEAEQKDKRLFIVIPGQVEESTLEQLQKEFEHFTLLLMANDQADTLPNWVKRLNPEIPPGREDTINTLYRAALRTLQWA
jgi:hypothetical protein